MKRLICAAILMSCMCLGCSKTPVPASQDTNCKCGCCKGQCGCPKCKTKPKCCDEQKGCDKEKCNTKPKCCKDEGK